MTILKAKGRQSTSVARVSEGDDVYLKALRDGSLTVADWIACLSLEGRVFTANAGVATTPITFGAGTLNVAEFDMHVAVPAGTVIIPLEMMITYAVVGAAAIMENVMWSGSGSTTGAGTSTTPQSSNVSSGLSSACTITSAATAGTAITVNIKEIWRDSLMITDTTTVVGNVRNKEVFRWRAKDSGILDVVGPSQQLVIIASAVDGEGCLTLKYAELPASALE